jgi:hypothetical protein
MADRLGSVDGGNSDEAMDDDDDDGDCSDDDDLPLMSLATGFTTRAANTATATTATTTRRMTTTARGNKRRLSSADQGSGSPTAEGHKSNNNSNNNKKKKKRGGTGKPSEAGRSSQTTTRGGLDDGEDGNDGRPATAEAGGRHRPFVAQVIAAARTAPSKAPGDDPSVKSAAARPLSPPERSLMGSPPLRHRQRRLYNDTAMDFEAIPPTRNGNNNRGGFVTTRSALLTGLVQRSVRGGVLVLLQSKGGKRTPERPKKWSFPPWVSLEHPHAPTATTAAGPNQLSHIGLTSLDRNKIRCVAWDSTGVLLAVATGRIVSIYDWDMVRAADVRGRSDRSRGCHESSWTIPPVVRFPVPLDVTSLVWNPVHADELAVGFR